MRIHEVENRRRRRKQAKNWKERVKWVVKGCGRRGRELITVNTYFMPQGHKSSTWVMPQGHKSSHNRFAP